MIPHLHLRLEDVQKTQLAGKSLAHSLYQYPITILLNGDLGAGKTTFLQGFAEELGIEDPLVSPTYALEQRYQTKTGLPFLHLDLYRLSEKDAMMLVDTTDDHEGIRCIEWADRLPHGFWNQPSIEIRLQEGEEYGREALMLFNDFPLPTDKQVEDWRAEVMLQPHITRHCTVVADVAMKVADILIANGTIVRRDALKKAAELHDLLRFIDFKAAPPAGITESSEEQKTWAEWKNQYANLRHEDACKQFLIEQKFPELGTIVETHGLRIPEKNPQHIEQKILFYADKRVMMDTVVSVHERFDDFVIRYSNGERTVQNSLWLEYTLQLERELFPEGVPELM